MSRLAVNLGKDRVGRQGFRYLMAKKYITKLAKIATFKLRTKAKHKSISVSTQGCYLHLITETTPITIERVPLRQIRFSS